MNERYSKKVILLVDGTLKDSLAAGFSSHGFSCGNSVLESFDALQKASERDVLASFVRAQIVSIIEREGMPYAFVLTFPSIKFASKEDNKGDFLLRVLFLVLLVVGMSQKYQDLRSNILIIAENEISYKKIAYEPASFISNIKAENDQIANRIKMLSEDNAAFSRLYFVRAMRRAEIIRDAALMVNGFIYQIDARSKLEKKIPVYTGGAISTKDDSASTVYYRAGNDVWINGEKASAENYSELRERAFVIKGSIHTKNIRNVITIIKKGIEGSIEGTDFPINDEIVIVIGEQCSIDKTVAAAFAQLFITELARYKTKKIIVSSVNDVIIRSSQGYSMIREFMRLGAE